MYPHHGNALEQLNLSGDPGAPHNVHVPLLSGENGKVSVRGLGCRV
jgi:hypothetical protein